MLHERVKWAALLSSVFFLVAVFVFAFIRTSPF